MIESNEDRQSDFLKRAGTHRPLRWALAAFVAFASPGIAPRLYSQTTAPAAPTFTQTNLVSNTAGKANTVDPNLGTPWGMTVGINGGLWVANHGSGKGTTYDGTGKPIPPNASVTIPTPSGTGAATATGVATNASPGFAISSGSSASLPSIELFATENGTIAGWNPSVDPANAVIVVDNSATGAVYKGLAIGFNESGPFLYAANFSGGTVDVFDSNFKPVSTPGNFIDPHLPAGYAPFGVSAINSKIYVSYALQDGTKKTNVTGAGLGFINIFDTKGNLESRFASAGALNSPWGMAWGSFSGFGALNNALFVGNFGDGTINAFDFGTGALIGQVKAADGSPIVIPGLWALQFGLAVNNASSTTLYFSAGSGIVGSLTANPPASSTDPTMLQTDLQVTSVITGLNQPTSMAFLGPNDFLVLEKPTGKVQHVVNGAIVGAAIDLAVNSADERGLLGIALQPNFASTHGIYLYWTESSTGADTNLVGAVPLLGNRVDRFVWDPAAGTLTQDVNIVKLRAFQNDAGEPMRANHNSGKIAFGQDGKLYIQIGDQGRRGQMQNLATGPFVPAQPDDEYGGPAPDDAHLTGVILRFNPDGTVPSDNPFAGVTVQQITALEQQHGVTLTPQQLTSVTANIQKVFSYGRRNSFGLAVDPMTGFLWESENGDDCFDEINRITAGSNGGWTQIMGPADRVADFKDIETTFTMVQGNVGTSATPFDPVNFIPLTQQVRYLPTRIADTTREARERLFVVPGSHYSNPEFSWRWAVAPAAIGFASTGLGTQHNGNLFVGAADSDLEGGYLFELKLDSTRQHFAFNDSRLNDLVDNNEYKFDLAGSGSLLAGRNFGIVTNIVSGPDGNLYVTSISKGAIYMIH